MDGRTRVVELDVSDQAQAARAIDGIVQEWGRLDVLVNAAGIASSGPTSRGPVIGIAEKDWDHILDVNLLGTVYCAQAAARHMMRQRSGRIVNIASIAGSVPRINGAAYGVSKAGVRMFTKCLALELARHGITVNAVAPGPIDTPMLGPESDQQVRGSAPVLRKVADNVRGAKKEFGELTPPSDIESDWNNTLDDLGSIAKNLDDAADAASKLDRQRVINDFGEILRLNRRVNQFERDYGFRSCGQSA